MDSRITKHFFEHGTMKYFRGNAHQIELGTYGQKKDPLGAKAYLAPQDKVKAEHLASRLKVGQPVKIDWNEVSEADLAADAQLKFFGLGKSVATAFSHEKARTAKLQLQPLYILEGPLTAMLNKDAVAARNHLAEQGADGRIVAEVWVVLEAELGEHFSTYGEASFGVKAFGSSLDVTVSGGKQGAQTITLAAGTTFAYKLYKVKNWNKGKTQIDDMEDDYKGMS